jgi:tetratricopeptide (TPR) repeat protein
VTNEEAERLLALARAADLAGPETPQWVERLTSERPRLAEAVRFFSGHGRHEEAAEIGANVWRLWLFSGEAAAGREFLAAALDGGELRPSRARALALYGDGVLAFRAGAQRESHARNEAALEAARAVGDREVEALALVGLSRVALRDGDYARVRELAQQARELVRDLDPSADVAPLHLEAAGTRLAGELDAAARLYEESLDLNRRLGDSRMVAVELHNLGHVELHRGNEDTADRCFAECAELRNADDPYDTAMTDLNRAAISFARGDVERARGLLHDVEAALSRAGIVLDPDDAYEVDWLQARLQRQP